MYDRTEKTAKELTHEELYNASMKGQAEGSWVRTSFGVWHKVVEISISASVFQHVGYYGNDGRGGVRVIYDILNSITGFSHTRPCGVDYWDGNGFHAVTRTGKLVSGQGE